MQGWVRGKPARAAALTLAVILPLLLPWRCRWDDVCLYASWGQQLLQGLVPYQDFAVEYPPGALLALIVPALLAASGVPFNAAFVVWTWGIDVLVRLWVLPRTLGPGRGVISAQWLYTVLQLPLYVLFFKRLDGCAAACATWALVLLTRRVASYLPWLWLAAGTLIKLYPLVLVPPMVLYAMARGLSKKAVGLRLAACGAAIFLGLDVAFLWAGPDSLDWLTYHQVRGLQVTSSYVAGHLLAAGVGEAIPHAFRFGAFEVTAPWADGAVRLSPVMMVLGQALTLGALGRKIRHEHDLYRMSLACLIALISTAKVFSPQYVIWLLPLTLLTLSTGKRRDLPLVLAMLGVCLMTGMLYPGETHMLMGQMKRQLALVARALLLLLLWAYLLTTSQTRAARPDAP